MQTCRLCGEEKSKEEFQHVIHFTKYKKHKVLWCKECQRMYMEMKKQEIKKDSIEHWTSTGIVSFD